VLTQNVRQWDDFTGRINAVATVELRPRVSGYLERVAYAEGQEVKKGDLLFVIDQRPYQAELARAQAALEKARSDADGAHNQVVLGTRTAFVTAMTQSAQVKALEASVASSKLALDATQLGYKVGVKVNLDVLNAQSQLFSTERDASGARYNYLLSQLKLRQVAGNLTNNDLLPIDALLAK